MKSINLNGVKIILFTLLFVCSNFLYGQENSLLWEIKGGGLKTSSYLYGTYHSKDSRAHQFCDSVLIKLAESNIVVTENVDAKNNIGKNGFGLALMKDVKLEDLLSKEDYAFVYDNAINKLGAMGILCNTMKPIITMSAAMELTSRQEMLYTVDEFIKSAAEKLEKKVYGMETAEEAMKAIDEISLKDQSDMLLDFFKNYDESMEAMESLIKIYQSQDLGKLYSFYESNKDASISLDKSLVIKRNNKFASELTSMIKEQSVFCAVGALHLPGETGLINSLRQNGYEVSPIYSSYIPKSLFIEDKREWYSYTNDSLYLEMTFPEDPTYEESTFLIGTTNNISAVSYSVIDSINELNYMVTIMNLPESIANNTNDSICDMILDDLVKEKGWKKIEEKNIEYQELTAREVEFNISQGVNTRYKMAITGGNIYLFGIAGFKDKLNSNIAEYFFDNMYISNCRVEIQLQVEDEVTRQLLNDFEVSITSNLTDTIFTPDTIGQLSFILPSRENEYIITISSNSYVSKKILVDTHGINKTKEKEIVLSGGTKMIKIKKGVDYSIFNKPIAKACLIDNSTFSWDMEYLTKMKEEINRQLGVKLIVDEK
jgi:uncharacterized protein